MVGELGTVVLSLKIMRGSEKRLICPSCYLAIEMDLNPAHLNQNLAWFYSIVLSSTIKIFLSVSGFYYKTLLL